MINKTNQVSFGSSYKFAMTQAGVNRTKREILKPTLEKYSDRINNFQIPNTGQGNGRISVAEAYDSLVEGILKRFNFKVYQKMALHDVPISTVDEAVRGFAKTGDYVQKGKQKKGMYKHK